MQAVAQKHYLGNYRNLSIEEEAAILERFSQKAEQGHMLDIHEIKETHRIIAKKLLENVPLFPGVFLCPNETNQCFFAI